MRSLAVLALLAICCFTQQQVFGASTVQVEVGGLQPQQPLVDNPAQQKQQQQQQQKAESATAAAAAAAVQDGEGVLPGDPDPLADAMIAWIHENGGEVNVAIRRNVPGAGRSTFAPRAFKKGEVLCRFPVEMAYALASQDDSLALSATYLMADMAEEDSPHAPYFNALPGPSAVWSSGHVPHSYMPIIQDEDTETGLIKMQENVDLMWEKYGDKYTKVLGPNVSPANITYAMGLLLTRLFRFDDTDVLLPVVDFANHNNTCLHSHLPEPCDPELGDKQWREGLPAPRLSNTTGSGVFGPSAAAAAAADGSSGSNDGSSEEVSGQCFVWRAEEALQPGQEVCNSYKTLFQDRSLLQYGFLQSGAPVHEMSTLDRHDRLEGLDNVWTDPEGINNLYGPRRFEGTPEQCKAEVARLQARLAFLESGDAAVAAIKPDPSDPGGYHLKTMLEWRRQRKEAIRGEIKRVERQGQRLARAAAAWGVAGEGAAGLAAANKELLQWLQDKGAQVAVELRQLEPGVAGSSQQQQCSSSSSDGQQTCAAGGTTTGTGTAVRAGVFTTKAVEAGDMLAVIPVELAYTIKSGKERLESAVFLMTDLQDVADEAPGNSPGSLGSGTPIDASISSRASSVAAAARPLLRSLPPFGSVRSLFNFPKAYLPLLQQARAASHITAIQHALSEEFESFRPDIEHHDNTTTLAELQHAASVIATRPLLPYEEGGKEHELLMPLLNNARHNSSCTHDYYIDACPTSDSSSSSSSSSTAGSSDSTGGKKGAHSAEKMCFFWKAGTQLPAGAEACVSYGHLRLDQAFIKYGLPLEQALEQQQQQQTQAAADGSSDGSNAASVLWLSGMDSREASGAKPFAPIAEEPLEHWIPADRDEALTECVWLLQVHKNWTQLSKVEELHSIKPVPSDPNGAFLQQLLQWRQQRIAAAEWELSRLKQLFNISSEELQQQLAEAEADNTAEEAESAYVIDSDFNSSSSDPWQRMLDWMRHNGAIINVNVTYAGPEYGRVVVANEPMTRGELLAALPVELFWNTEVQGANGTLQLAAANFWAEIKDPASPFRPYLDALRTREELLCPIVQMPPEYVSLLQSDSAEGFVSGYQQQLTEFWTELGADLHTKLPSLTYDTFKYARALLATRLFGLRRGASMIPLLDLANHSPNCTNSHSEEDCPHDPNRRCVVWTAGAFIAQGGEVCNTYKWMSNDRSFLQYGFLQSGPIKHALHTVDHPDTNSTNIFTVHDKLKYGPEPFNGTEAETQAEIQRLQSILANVTSGDAAAAALAPAAGDKGGRLLALIRAWRQERKEVLQKHIEQLQQRLQRLAADAAAAAEGDGAVREAKKTPEEVLVEWIEAHGGKVNGVRVGYSTQSTEGNAAAAAAAPRVRGVYATAAAKSGSLLAAVPLELAVPVDTNELLADGPALYTDIYEALSPKGPYWDTLPPPDEVFSFYELPLSYAPVVQHVPTMEFVYNTHVTLDAFEKDDPTQFTWRNMTRAELQDTLSLVATRLVTFREGAHLVPLIDLANHQNGCPHTLEVKACDSLSDSPSSSSSSSSKSSGSSSSKSSGSSSSKSGGSGSGHGGAQPGVINTTRSCVVWKAGRDIAAGEEVCLAYGYMLPDRAMLQYGFIPGELIHAVLQQQQQQQGQGQQEKQQQGVVHVPLFGFDRHDFKETAVDNLPWKYWLDSASSPEPFSGSAKDLHYEILRLELLLDDLTAGDEAAAAVQPDPELDASGAVLQMLRLWRRLRIMGITQEIARLKQLQQQQKDEL